jgi:hypothetical protein
MAQPSGAHSGSHPDPHFGRAAARARTVVGRSSHNMAGCVNVARLGAPRASRDPSPSRTGRASRLSTNFSGHGKRPTDGTRRPNVGLQHPPTEAHFLEQHARRLDPAGQRCLASRANTATSDHRPIPRDRSCRHCGGTTPACVRCPFPGDASPMRRRTRDGEGRSRSRRWAHARRNCTTSPACDCYLFHARK